MPSSKNDYIGKTAKIIYKNSRSTINTYSGVSQILTKSLIFKLKRNLPKEDYYEKNGTVKRDLSIETDVCILRGYYKKKRNKKVRLETIPIKSKYSVNHTEIDTIDEYNSSACGDSKGSSDTHFYMNLTSLVVRNLKQMMNDWVKTYLMGRDETKQNIDSILESLLHNLDIEPRETVSSCTYTVDQCQKRERKKMISHLINSTKHKSFSVPLGGKSYKIMSTLSVPKNIHRQETSKYSWNKLNKMRHGKILLSTTGSGKHIFNSSSLNFLTLPTKFLTKCCTTYDQENIIENNKGKQTCFVLPDEHCSNKNLDYCKASRHSDTTRSKKKSMKAQHSALTTIPSIYKNMYNNHMHNEIHNLENRSVNCVHEQDSSVPLVTIDPMNQSFEFIHKAKQNNQNKKNHDLMRKDVNKTNKKFTHKINKNKLRVHKIKTNKTNTIFSPKRDYIKLDINVNVYSSKNCQVEKKLVNTCTYSLAKTSPAYIVTINDDSLNEHKIIPLLDGAISQAQYFVSREVSTNSSKNNNCLNMDHTTSTLAFVDKESQIGQEIGELKLIIQTLANTTEQLVKDHINKNKFSTDNISKPHSEGNTKKRYDDLENLSKQSKGVQMSSKFVNGCAICSGIKLKKDPKKKYREYQPRLMKRSTSYDIIDSESILRVTDMTSAAQGEINMQCKVNRALSCSLQKIKSLNDVSVGTNDQEIAARQDSSNPCDDICNDDFKKPEEFVYNVYEHKPRMSYTDKSQLIEPSDESKVKIEHQIDPEVLSVNSRRDDGKTVCIDIETKNSNQNQNGKKITIRHSRLTFCAGCLYCIFFWIPLISILWLFYDYVLEDYLPGRFQLRKFMRKKGDVIHDSYFRRTLSDLGF